MRCNENIRQPGVKKATATRKEENIKRKKVTTSPSNFVTYQIWCLSAWFLHHIFDCILKQLYFKQYHHHIQQNATLAKYENQSNRRVENCTIYTIESPSYHIHIFSHIVNVHERNMEWNRNRIEGANKRKKKQSNTEI